MIIGINGNLGNGKTATMARLAMHFSSLCAECSGIIDKSRIIPVFLDFHPKMCKCVKPAPNKIHSNFWLNGIKNVHYVSNLTDIEKVYSGYTFYDELYTWIDSRGSGFSDINQLVTSILHKSRKRGYNIIYEAKLQHMVDRRIRELTDYILEPYRYINCNGELLQVEQQLLYPVKHDLNKTWIVVDELSGAGLNVLNKSYFQFPLTDVADIYDTTEEIKDLSESETHPGLEKGIKIETEFSKFLSQRFPNMEIVHATLSRGLDIVLKNDEGGFAFDVVSPQFDKKKYLRIDLRRKNVENLIKLAEKQNCKPYWAFRKDDSWYVFPMTREQINRSMLNVDRAVDIMTVKTI